MTQSVREREDEYFTLVFKGDLRKFAGNPLKTETPFGVPWAASLGDVCAEADALREQAESSPDLAKAVEALKPFAGLANDIHPACPDDGALVLTNLSGGIIDTSNRIVARDLRLAREAYQSLTRNRE